MSRLEILLADGRRVVREALALVLNANEDIHVAGHASDLAFAQRLIKPLQIDVVVINSQPADPATRSTILSLIAAHPQLAVVICFMTPSLDLLRAMLAAGVKGCLSKECDSDAFLECIRAVGRGETYVSSTLKQSLFQTLVESDEGEPTLSAREQQVLERIASGYSTKEVASSLGVGAKTVETHRRRIMQKLGRDSIAELTQYAMMHGLVVPSARPA